MVWLAENWFWLLIFLLFVLMHLFGHGGHGTHGGHEHRPDGRSKDSDSDKSGEHSHHH